MLLLVVAFAAIAFAVSLLPTSAKAFWLFSTNADAATARIPSSSTPLLVAALNSNPSAPAPIALATSDDSALLPYIGPAGGTLNVSGAASDRISVYVVRPGDTLSDISKMFGVSVNTILWANNIKSARDVHPGDTLIILPVSGIQRTIAKGDTLQSLAKKFGADAEEIAIFNGLDASESLAVGETIIIPGGELSAPPSAPKSKAAPRSPLFGGGGIALLGFFSNPVPAGHLTQGLHGWNGIDLGAPRGTPIYAAAGGTVIIARGAGYNGGYGKYAVITHENGVQTLYAHMSQTIVTPGEPVLQGQLIGYVGNTGRSTGSHLHFEVRGAKNPFAQ